MVSDPQTNFVFFSRLLQDKFNPEFDSIRSILDTYGISNGLLEGTKDIWCKDYMPVQVSKNEFIGFKYSPSYMQKPKYLALQSDSNRVCRINSIPTKFCDINLDGGNLVKWEDRVIISDRIFKENNSKQKNRVIDELEKRFQVEVIIIPCIKSDLTGHADGLVRFVSKNTIILNELRHEYKYWREGIKKVISKYNFNYYEIPWFEPSKNKTFSAMGCYINFLEVGNLVILPQFKKDNGFDKKVYSIFKNIYPTRIIETIEINRIAEQGGLLNCICWNILK